METRPAVDPLQPKTWQLDRIENGNEGYLYHCMLCDEALVLSKQQINPRKIKLVFDGTCPSCGFELERVLSCRPSLLPAGRRLLTSLKCKDPDLLREPDDQIEYQTRRGSALTRDLQPGITTGIDSLDRALILKTGQFVFLEGEPSHALSLLLCVRATLPQGLDSDVVFIDAGNLFDTYTISQHTVNLGLETSRVQQRIHLSRAFTHHQVHSLIVEKLTEALDKYGARLAVVSDITALFCDPEGQRRLYAAHHSPSSLHSSEGRRGCHTGQNATWIPVVLPLSNSFASVSHSFFVPLFRISPGDRERTLIHCEASRLDSRPLPQTRPDGSLAEKTRWKV